MKYTLKQLLQQLVFGLTNVLLILGKSEVLIELLHEFSFINYLNDHIKPQKPKLIARILIEKTSIEKL